MVIAEKGGVKVISKIDTIIINKSWGAKNLKKFSLLLFLYVMLAASINAGSCTVDATTTYQYIRCIGASSAWSGVGSWGQVLFADDNVDGHIGLSSLRTRIDPNADINGSGVWNSELDNIKAAYVVNPNILFWSTAWSPPAVYKSNNCTCGYYLDGGGNKQVGSFLGADSGSSLNSADTSYASYLTQYVQYCKSYTGVTLYAVSAQNEPSFEVDYEGSNWTPGQFDVFIPVLHNALQSAGLSTKIMMPEVPNEWGMDMASTTMNDPNVAPMVDIIGIHLYGTYYNPLSQFNFTQVTNQEFWATEISAGCVEPISSDISCGLAVAGWAHNSLVEAQMNAFHYWWLNDLIANNAPTSVCYALGNFSKFIRPGYYRMGATEVPSSGLQVSAYKNTNNSSPTAFVIVVINNNTSAVDQTFSLNSLNATSVTPWLTNIGNGLVAQSAVPVSGNSFTYSLPASSIVSFEVGIACNSTAITPYMQVNGGSWQQGVNSVMVTSLPATVNLGPQPTTGGSWSWTGPNGFTSTAREIDNIPLSQGSNVFTAAYTNTSGCISTKTFTICAATAIIPYVQVNGGSWQQGVNSVTVPSLPATVNLGPQSTNGGSWSWSGPNGFTSTSRQIDGIPLSAGINTFTVVYTNACGLESTEIFMVSAQVTPTSTPTITGTFTMISSATFTQTSTFTPTGTYTPTPVVASTWRVNSGGPAYTDSLGNLWAADENYSGGDTIAIGGAVAGTSDSTLYDTQHYGNSFSYTFNVPAGAYQVTLKFAETYSGDFSAGARVFNVVVNGTTVLPDLDVYAQVGANTEDDKMINNVSPVGGVITIQFTGTSSTDVNAMVEAIQIIPQPPTPTVTATPTKTSTATPTASFTPTFTITPSPTFTGTNTPSQTFTSTGTPTLMFTKTFTPSYTGTPIKTPSPTLTQTLTFTPTKTNTATNTPSITASQTLGTFTMTSSATFTQTSTFTPTGTYTPTPVVASTWRVNAGGPGYIDSLGNLWAADENYSGGFTNVIGGAVAGTSDSTLYDTQHYGNSFSYTFNVPAGAYQVTLKFAETYSSDFAAGARVFNVAINGTTVLPNLDVYAQVGPNTEDDKVINNVSPAGGVITIQFTGTSSTDANAMVEAIQIIPQPPTPTVTATPTKTSTVTPMASFTPTFTITSSPTFTGTNTPPPFTSTGTPTLMFTKTFTSSYTGTPTKTPSPTLTRTLTSMPTRTKTATNTSLITASHTFTQTPGNTFTPTFVPTNSLVVPEKPLIYPNPSTGRDPVKILVPLSLISDVRIEIFTVSFRKISDKIYTNIIPGTILSVSVTGPNETLPASGVYYVEIFAENKRWAAPLLIIR